MQNKLFIGIVYVLVWFCIPKISCLSIAYDIHTTQMSAQASFEQAGVHTAAKTIDGIYNESMWAVAGNESGNNYIMWNFNNGLQTLDRMQILNDGHWNHPHNLIHFALYYSVKSNPQLSNESDWQVLDVLEIGNFAAIINGNEINVTSASPDYYIRWATKSDIKAIRLRAFPYAGNHSNYNFVLNEVSFNLGTHVGVNDGLQNASSIPEANTFLLLVASLAIVYHRAYHIKKREEKQ